VSLIRASTEFRARLTAEVRSVNMMHVIRKQDEWAVKRSMRVFMFSNVWRRPRLIFAQLNVPHIYACDL